MRATSKLGLFFAAVMVAAPSVPALAKHATTADENMAVVLGEAGEKYPIYGVGGVKVTGGHHGFWSSNIKSSAIQIDGSGIAAKTFMPVNVNTDFTAAAGGAYFVSTGSVCTLPTAAGAAGQEIVVCNASKDATISYQPTQGETLLGGDKSGAVVNSIPGKVDRFISDGRSWYRE